MDSLVMAIMIYITGGTLGTTGDYWQDCKNLYRYYTITAPINENHDEERSIPNEPDNE